MPLRRRRCRRCRSTLRHKADERAALALPQLGLRTSQSLAQPRRICRDRFVSGVQARGGSRQLELSLGEPSDDLGVELEAGGGRCGRYLCRRRSGRSGGRRERWRSHRRGWRWERAVLDSKCVFGRGRAPLALLLLLLLLDLRRRVGLHVARARVRPRVRGATPADACGRPGGGKGARRGRHAPKSAALAPLDAGLVAANETLRRRAHTKWEPSFRLRRRRSA